MMLLFGLMLALQLQWQTVADVPVGEAPPTGAPPAAVPPAVVAPEDVQEFERPLRPRLAEGSWKRFTGAGDLVDGQVVFTFGSRAARETRLPGRRVIEFFVAGSRPLVEGHELAPWEAPVGAHLFLLNRFAANRAGRAFCVLATPRTREWAQRLASSSAGLVQSQDVENPSAAMQLAADLIAGRRRCAGVLLTGDFEVLDWRVLETFVQLQARAGIPVFARTRHEVLLGAVAAVEPQYESWDANPASPPSGQIFYHRHMSAWFGVEEIVSSEWKPQPLAR